MLTSGSKPILALCGTGATSGNRNLVRWQFPARGRLTAEPWGDAPADVAGFRGLPWGVGGPAAAFLDSEQWAVVRVDDEAGPVPVPAAPGVTPAVAAVEFRTGTVIYRGDPRGAIETLIQHGADRDAMSVALALPDADGFADVGPYGVAVAGDSGMARGADHSRVFVQGGYGGLAVAGRHGQATVDGVNGIAAVGPDGRATASGLAVARDVGGWVTAGDEGVAVMLGTGHGLTVGADAIGVALAGVARVSAGPRSIIVVREATGDTMRVCLGEGALIIIRFFEPPDEAPRFTIAHAGRDGLEPGVSYVWVKGVFRKRSEYVAEETKTPCATPALQPSPWPFSCGEIVRAGADGVVRAEGGGWAIAERDQVATAGTGGLAMADEASAGDLGLAITGGGTARAGCCGIAVCDDKRYGRAEAGLGGVAVGLGSRYGMITADNIGAAIYGGSFGIVTAGDEGIAIGGFESSVRVGRNGVAIASHKCPLGEAGSLLVCRGPEGQFRSAVVDEHGTIPPEFMEWAMQFDRQRAAERAAHEAAVRPTTNDGSLSG